MNKSQKGVSKSEQTKLDSLSTTSGKIRYLNGLGWSRGDISRFLGIRYQWVRNVLVTPVKEPREK
jgi:hypothetical protein